MRFVLATGNANKLIEMREILSELDIEVLSPGELGLDIDIEETGVTFMENALLKARAVCNAAQLPAIADDSGLMVDALGGAPGVYSKRYGGGGLSEREQCALLLENLKDTTERSARFVCCIACVFPDGTAITAEGECRGEILYSMRGDSGFGYDPVFLVAGTGKSMAEMLPDEKNAVSHRGIALRRFTAELLTNLKGK